MFVNSFEMRAHAAAHAPCLDPDPDTDTDTDPHTYAVSVVQ